jgi:O-acetyl-ADP-ribose deacetylase (regulator of RNase III)
MNTPHVWHIGLGRLELHKGDLTTTRAEALVNAANSRLAGGGGVDGAIHAKAGPGLLEAGQRHVAEHGPLAPGDAVLTPGFDLDADHVIHAVGPVYRGGDQGEPRALARAYARSLELSAEAGADSAAFPAISCGAYGYPIDLAAPIALEELARGLERGLLKRAELWIYSTSSVQRWLAAARQKLGEPDTAT